MPRESEIENTLVEGVVKLGGQCLKWVSPGRAGVPDRVVLMPCGRVHFVELKSLSGRVSAVQQHFIEKANALGHHIHVLKGQRSVLSFLSHLEKLKAET